MKGKRSEYGIAHGLLRLLCFLGSLLWFGLIMLVRRPHTLRDRLLWKQRLSLSLAHRMGMEIDVVGNVPAYGMIVSNHLSYLDAVAFGSILPAVFVAKAEVRTWPLLGWLTASGGTLFLRRDRMRVMAEVNRELSSVLAQGSRVVLFPEGTTTGASDPLPFHPALFEPAARGGIAVWPAALAYTIDGACDGVPDFVCYWADMTFLPHLVRLMRQRRVRAVVQFADTPVIGASRQEVAVRSHEAVRTMLQEGLKPARRCTEASVRLHESAAAQALQN